MPTDTEPASEPSRAEKAFALFLSLGDRRTYRQVADQMGVALATVKRYAKVGRWQCRVREQEAKAARELVDRYQAGQVAQNERNLKIVRAALLSLAKDVAERRIKGQYSDIPRLVQLEKDLQAAPMPERDGPPREGVIIYIPDNGRNPGSSRVYTTEELRQEGLTPPDDDPRTTTPPR